VLAPTCLCCVCGCRVEDLRYANTTLTAFNDESERAYEAMSAALKKHTALIKSIQTDLMDVFKRIRYISLCGVARLPRMHSSANVVWLQEAQKHGA
jgi:hypothetical protein